MPEPYVLYGSYASYYTAKVRAYLRKKGIPFVERLPSDPMFRNKVRPASGSHRIPQLLTPSGDVLQDSVTILDHLEALHPEVPAFPTTPCQRTLVHLMELLGSEGLVRLAWMHRWMFDENDHFVKMEFGRSFKPQGSDAELLKYGQLIADRMKSYGLPTSTQAVRHALDEQYRALLQLYETHFTHYPYLLGGHPCAADYAVMGALHAHMGRDPAGLHIMQQNAPRVFRWVEHMLVPEILSPEFFSVPVAYPENDVIPETATSILNHLADQFALPFVLGAKAFAQAMQRQRVERGHELNAEQDQPLLPTERVRYEGVEHEHSANLYAVWLTQRSQRYVQSLNPELQQKVVAGFDSPHLQALLDMPVDFPIERVGNRLVIGCS